MAGIQAFANDHAELTRRNTLADDADTTLRAFDTSRPQRCGARTGR